MDIRRFGVTSEHGPLISRGVIHNGTLHLSGITAAGLEADTADQTRAVLKTIEALLAEAGTDKDRVLTAHIWLADMADFQIMNGVWNDWVDADRPPARTCVSGELYDPDCRIEIAVTASVDA
jgi:enamine deaminase RidA (YjgF/YER057c/UK114 family)